MRKLISSVVVSSILLGSSVYAKDSYGEVNGQLITKEDIAMLIRNPAVDFDALPKKTQDEVLTQLAEKILLSQEALKSNVINSPEFATALSKLRGDLALEFWMQDIAKNIVISTKEVEDFYAKNKDKFASATKYKAKHILVKTEDEAKKIIAELKKSKKPIEDFMKLAKEKTQDPSGKANGGDLGWFEANKMVPEFSKATSELKIGAFSLTPVKTDYGYHVIYLEDAKEIEMEQVKQVMVRELFSQKVKQISSELKKTAKITIN